jgi:hypothetical protein
MIGNGVWAKGQPVAAPIARTWTRNVHEPRAPLCEIVGTARAAALKPGGRGGVGYGEACCRQCSVLGL